MRKYKLIRSILLLIFILPVFNSVGQETKRDKSIKIYSNFSFPSDIVNVDTSYQYPVIYSFEESKLGYLSPAISFVMPNGNSHELEISRLSWNKTSYETKHYLDSVIYYITSGSDIIDFEIAIRYEYNLLLRKKKMDARLLPYIGLSINPYYSFSQDEPHVSISYPRQTEFVGAFFSIIPRLTYHFNEKWFVDLNIPIHVAEVNWRIYYTDNPALPEELRETVIFEDSLFPKDIILRFGVGFSF